MIKHFHYYILFISFATLLDACIVMPNSSETIIEGQWRGELIIKNDKQEFVTEGRKKVVTRDVLNSINKRSIPFNFNIFRDSLNNKLAIEIINGSEKIKFNSIATGRNIQTGQDTFYIKLDPYDACLKGIYRASKMMGHFIVLDKVNYSIPFEADYGQLHRFEKIPEQSAINITGEWQTIFGKDTKDAYNAIGEFVQTGSTVNGSFRTETGDYRFLNGQLSGNRCRLSCFDGAHAFLFDVNIYGDSLKGIFYSGHKYQTSIHAAKSENTILRHSDSLTKFIGTSSFEFSVTDLKGESIVINKSFLPGKAKIIQVMGTWCPNCRDESIFLKNYVKARPSEEEIVVMAVSFERLNTLQEALKRISDYKNSMEIPYDIFYGGPASKDSASAVFHQLSGIKSFPTLIFVDKENNVKRIHTGFDGPATSQFEIFKKEFYQTVLKLK